MPVGSSESCSKPLCVCARFHKRYLRATTGQLQLRSALCESAVLVTMNAYIDTVAQQIRGITSTVKPRIRGFPRCTLRLDNSSSFARSSSSSHLQEHCKVDKTETKTAHRNVALNSNHDRLSLCWWVWLCSSQTLQNSRQLRS